MRPPAVVLAYSARRSRRRSSVSRLQAPVRRPDASSRVPFLRRDEADATSLAPTLSAGPKSERTPARSSFPSSRAQRPSGANWC